MNGDIRESVIAGSWYPGNPKILRRDIEEYLRLADVEDISGDIVGLIAPHAGYVYSGPVAAYAYKPIRGRTYQSVIIISPSHRMAFPGVSVYGRGGYETPLGIVPVDTVLAEAIIGRSTMINDMPAAHRQEHALEIQIPFLQVVLGEFSMVPLVMGSQDSRTCEELAQAVVKSIGDRKVLVVGSSDLSHFHDYDHAVKLDALILEHLSSMDAPGLLKDLRSGRCEACGGGPAAVTMMIAGMMGATGAKMMKYANSGDITGDRERVVGYASAVYFRSS